jgi:hypothetical protein
VVEPLALAEERVGQRASGWITSATKGVADRRLCAIDGGHLRTRLRECLRDGSADRARDTRDKCGLAVECAHGESVESTIARDA